MTEKQENRLKMNLQFFAEKPEVEPVVEVPAGEVITEPVVEEVPPEPVVPSVEETIVSPEVEALTAQVAELTAELATVQEQLAAANSTIITLTAEKESVSTEAATAKEKAQLQEKALQAVVDEKAERIPEPVKLLMPDNLSATEQLDWLIKAEAAIPDKPESTVAVLEIGKPTPVQTDAVDQSGLSVTQRMSNAFGEIFPTFNKQQ